MRASRRSFLNVARADVGFSPSLSPSLPPSLSRARVRPRGNELWPVYCCFYIRSSLHSITGCLLCVAALLVVVLSDGDELFFSSEGVPSSSSSPSSSLSSSPSFSFFSSFFSTGNQVSGFRFSQGQFGIVARPVSATPAP